jgi:quercetin 2,3-dioxygenase
MKTIFRPIERIIPPPSYHWVGDGFKVHNFLPGDGTLGLQRMSPFFLLDYNAKTFFEPSLTPKGVGVHPHRGFETVTIAYHGKVEHHDSAGYHGIIDEGDVQWMTAASGILHKEYHEKEWSKKGGWFQMVQLWINLPAKFKMSTPNYQPIINEKMMKHILDDGESKIELIAGQYKEAKGIASTFTPIEVYNAKLIKNGEAIFDFPASYNTAFLVIEGNVQINATEVNSDHLVLFSNQDGMIQLKANENSTVLILSGQPIDEPIFSYGPFLMNTQEEIVAAYDDFEAGKFGHLED